MKDEDIKLPNMPCLVNSQSWYDDIQEYARQAVRMNMPASKQSEPEPFDLARAKAGEPIVTRDGRSVKFVAHVPEVRDQGARVLTIADGDDYVSCYWESGQYETEQSEYDLFMAPKPKRTVWVNVWSQLHGGIGVSHPAASTEEEARDRVRDSPNVNFIIIAHPIEIDA